LPDVGNGGNYSALDKLGTQSPGIPKEQFCRIGVRRWRGRRFRGSVLCHHGDRWPQRGSEYRGNRGPNYATHDQIIATTVVAIVAVASQPMICSAGGSVNLAMTARRIVMNIIVTINGTATTPFRTALQ